MLRRKGYITVKEAAELLSVAPNTVRAWGAAGSITEYRHPVNNYRLFKRNEVDALKKQLDNPPTCTSQRKPNSTRKPASK